MLDVEPPAGLRGRVIDRIESPRRGFAWIWIAAPVTAVAILILAVLLPSKTARPVVDPVTTVATTPPATAPRPATTAPQPAPQPAPLPRMRRGAEIARRVSASPLPRTVSAAVAPDDLDFEGARVAALAPPAPLTIQGLPGPRPTTIAAIELGRSIEPAPLEIRALELNTLTETPRERREE
jgi:hypothetical protein